MREGRNELQQRRAVVVAFVVEVDFGMKAELAAKEFANERL